MRRRMTDPRRDGFLDWLEGTVHPKGADMARHHGRDQDEERGFGPKDGRGRFSGRYTREQDERTGGRELPRGKKGRADGDASRREGGERGGYAGSFERESDDYDRSMGRKDRGAQPGGRTSRDDDYVELAEESRFNDRGDGQGKVG
jgi:hypothetical protein